MGFVVAIVLSLISAAMARPGTYVCSETATGGGCYGALGGPRSARFQSYSWGGEAFLATYAGQSFHCTAAGPEVFARAAASSDYIAVTWDRYHQCTAIDIDIGTPSQIDSTLIR